MIFGLGGAAREDPAASDRRARKLTLMKWLPVGVGAVVLAALFCVRFQKPDLTVRSVDPAFKVLGAHYYAETNLVYYRYGKHARLFNILDRWFPRFALANKTQMIAGVTGPALVVYLSCPAIPTPTGWRGPPIHPHQDVRLYDDKGEQAYQGFDDLDEIGAPTNCVEIYSGKLDRGTYHLRVSPEGANVVDILVP